jgi:GNAT superfamily N-acetyltransferase
VAPRGLPAGCEGTPVLLTRELDELISRCEIGGIQCAIDTVARLYPEARPASAQIAGGLAAFTGADSPLSQAYGIGTSAPVTTNDVAQITEFYESRGAAPRVFVTPLADSSLARLLAATGYAPTEYENVLASSEFDAHALYDDRIAVAADLDVWARASAQAFLDRTTIEPADERIARILAFSDGACNLEARDGGSIVATAAMDIRDECSAFFAGSTMPASRGRGFHIALIRDRIARARDAGARLMRATARPASASERNFHRCGFVTLYTRALWERRKPG